jgi:predicted nucleic acid-binding protein
MPVVVADTSPINYLILIGHADLLLRLYAQVLIPEEVFAELIN